MPYKFIGKIERIDSQVWYHVVIVPPEISDHFHNGDRRIVAKINDQIQIHVALMPIGGGGYFININKEIRKQLKLTEGSSADIEIWKDESKYGMPMPEELGELLKIDDEADQYFHKLTRGKQRSLIHLVSKPKNTDTRLKKALVITDYLKSTRGRLDFKELNEAFKNSHY